MTRITFGNGRFVEGYTKGYEDARRDYSSDVDDFAAAATMVAVGVGLLGLGLGLAIGISAANKDGLVADAVIAEGNLGV